MRNSKNPRTVRKRFRCSENKTKTKIIQFNISDLYYRRYLVFRSILLWCVSCHLHLLFGHFCCDIRLFISMFEENNNQLMDPELNVVEDGSNHRCALLLIELYKTFRQKVGSSNVKTFKKMWEIISIKMNENGYDVTPVKVENKWKVLERNYKKTVDNNNKTGRAHKIFPYQRQFDDIYKQKVNIYPKLLLSSNREITPTAAASASTSTSSTCTQKQNHKENIPSTSTLNVPEISICAEDKEKQNPIKSKKKATYQKRNEIISEMKNNLKQFYDAKISLEKEKLELRRNKLQFDQRKLEAIQQHTEELRKFNTWAIKENHPRNPFF